MKIINEIRSMNFMIRLSNKSKSFTMSLLIMLGVFTSTSSVLALDYTEKNSLSNLIQLDSSGNIRYSSPDKVVNDTYWADLEKASILTRYRIGHAQLNPDNGKTMTRVDYEDVIVYGVLPQYILKPNETSLKKFDIDYSGGFVRNIPSSGITESELGMKIIAKDLFYRYSYLIGKDADLPYSYYSNNNMKPTDEVPAITNPFGLKKTDVLKEEEVKDPRKITVYGDIKESGDSNSSKIGEYKVGDEIKLDFSVDASAIKRYFMSYTLSMTKGDLFDVLYRMIYDDKKGMIDSQLVYTLDIPDEVDLRGASVSLNGLEDFELEKNEIEVSGRKKLLISLRLKKDVREKEEAWRDLINKFKKIDMGKIKVSVSGLFVNSSAQADTNISIRGSLGGYLDWASSDIILTPPPVSSPIAEPSKGTYYVDETYTRIYLTFVARQSDLGRDAGAPNDKPNLISYTFKVKKNLSSTEKPIPGRIDGRDRIETAIKISKNSYDKANTVIVVRHDLFPDSMTASVLAKLKDAPILLNPTDKLDSRVGDEIKRLGAQEIIIVGGQNSVSEKVREELKAYDADKNVERIAGDDRYGTSEMVAKRVVGITGKKNTGVVASGQVFPDALSVGTFASREGYPILLVKKDSIPSQIQNAIKDLDINKTYIAGGTNTISKSTEAKLPNVVERMAGSTRYETSVAIAKSKFGASKEAYIASGEEFADALVISPISGKFNRPTLLVSRNKNSNSPVKTYIRNAGFTSITAIGGERFVPYSVLEDLVK